MAALLLVAVVGLPLLLKDDGTAKGLAQILLTYTLSSITALLGFFTLWLGCGSLAREVEDCQIQMVAVKPIARWQVWFGKWLGILALNALLLAISGAAVFSMLMLRAGRLPAAQREILRSEVLVARGSARPPMKDLNDQIRRAIQGRLASVHRELSTEDKIAIQNQVMAAVIATNEGVGQMETHEWKFDLGGAASAARNQPMQLRVKFHTSSYNEEATYDTQWLIGPPDSPRSREVDQTLPQDSFQEFDIPSDEISDDGTLTVSFRNPNALPVQFSMEDGIEVLYRETSFGVNFCRGLGVILCWLGFMAAIGLAAGSFLSFPVAAFTSLGVLAMAMFSNTLKSVVENGTIMGWDSAESKWGHSPIDLFVVPLFKAALTVVNLATTFSPVDYLSSGRSITWLDLGLAIAQIVLLLGGVFGILGVILFTRRELAASQTQS